MKKTTEELIKFYETRLEKVKSFHLVGRKEGSLEWEKGMEYVKFAETALEEVKNGRGW